MKRNILISALTLLLVALVALPIIAQDDEEMLPADIVNDEGGVTKLVGEVPYTVGFLTDFIPGSINVVATDISLVIDRSLDPRATVPEENQILGTITSDPYVSPFTYELELPIVPTGEFRDVDNDEDADEGVLVMNVNIFINTFTDPYWNQLREYGAGLLSTTFPTDFETRNEISGGKILIWAPDDEQGFPSGFGEDGLLFTEDDPAVMVPAGYTVVDLDTEPFTFDRAAEATVNLIEQEQSLQPADYSELSYTEAFDALFEQMVNEYSFTEYKGVDWDALYEEFAPRFEEAEANEDSAAYQFALRDFSWSIPDGHIGASLPLTNDAFFAETDGSIGIAIIKLDDGRTVVNYVVEGSPAAEAGIVLGTEVLEINGVPVDEAIENAVTWSAPFSSPHAEIIQQLRYAVRFEVDTEVELTYQLPDAEEPVTETFTTYAERESWSFTSVLNGASESWAPPLEFEVLDSGYGYIRINTFSDDPMVTLRLAEWAIATLNEQDIPGLILDMRFNGGGYNISSWIAGMFHQEEVVIGNSADFYPDVGDFAVAPENESIIFPNPDGLYYGGPIALITGLGCFSECEFFSYSMTLEDRATTIGFDPTEGLGGNITPVFMPDGVSFQFTVGRALTPEGEIRLEGIGVPLDIQVPRTEETVFSEDDVLLNTAIEFLDEATALEVIDAGEIAIGDTVEGELAERTRVAYTLTIEEDTMLDFVVGDEAGELDTYLRIYVQGNDAPALENDDDEAGGTVNSALREVEIPAGLTLIVEVGGFDDAAAGAFTLSITETEAAGEDVAEEEAAEEGEEEDTEEEMTEEESSEEGEEEDTEEGSDG